MAFPLIARCSVGLLFCLTALPLQSQSGHGFSVRERAGLVLVKPQPWSKDNDATLLEFDAFINRTADGGFGAGYYEFRTKSAGRRQIPRARIVKLIIYPYPEQFREIVTPEERGTLVSKIDELSAAAAKFPASRNYLEPLIGKLADEVRRYDSGEVKTDGAWMTKDAYIKRLATRVAGQLKQEIARAKSSTDIDLEDDPSFAALKELAKDNSDARQLATDVSSQYETLLRAEKRRALLARLS
ncbi:MAG TPA: hypothetical protein VIT23_12715, partial [Terrimicrobiaceae bacterium]